MDPQGFLTDLERKPEVLSELADGLSAGNPWGQLEWLTSARIEQVLLIGMGSSTFAAGTVAAHLRRDGLNVQAELASSQILPPADPRRLVVAVSASGNSAETLAAAQRYAGTSPLIALTNVEASPLEKLADRRIDLAAQPEVGGVASRSYLHTLIHLLLMGHALRPTSSVEPLLATIRRAAEAIAYLLDSRSDWLTAAVASLGGPHGCWAVGPDHRFANVQQSALMIREGPRRAAVACETGDWSHVDVYLTKTLDYRMLLFPGSDYEPELLQWTTQRGSRVVTVGADISSSEVSIRYPHDHDDAVRLLTEVLIAELVAHHWWSNL